MIGKVKIRNEKNSIIHKCWGDREFEFTDKLNIIFGPNGCGKSVLLNTISHYVSIDERGWSAPLTPYRDGARMNRKNEEFDYSKIINESSKLGHIDIEWDGIAAYKVETNRDSMSMLTNLMQGGETEELSLSEAVSLKFAKVSSGQNTSYFINKLLNLVVPDLMIYSNKNYNYHWQLYGKVLADYVKLLKRDGKPTLLMDEPDKSLDYNTQQFFWDKIVDVLSEKFQVIIVTHSVFALSRTRKNANIIDKEDYFDTSKSIVTNALNIN